MRVHFPVATACVEQRLISPYNIGLLSTGESSKKRKFCLKLRTLESIKLYKAWHFYCCTQQ